MNAADILRKHGIVAPSSHGHHYVVCPKCSASRSTPQHRNAKVLGITIDDQGVQFGCNHCEFRGGAFYRGNGKANGHDHADPFVATYSYVDEAGALLFQICRTRNKQFPQRRPDGAGWAWGTSGVRKVLYRLPGLIEAIANEYRIVIVEGEKDVDALWRINVPATCNPGGASKPGQATARVQRNCARRRHHHHPGQR